MNQANAAVFDETYAGLAVAWDHMGGKSYGILTNPAGNRLAFSNGLSLCANKMNGYIFFGTFYNLKKISLFISPEFQIGQGDFQSQIKNTAPDPNVRLGSGTLLPRRMEPKLRRQMTTSFIVRLGSKVLESFDLYGLIGTDVSRFKYSYIVENVETTSAEINGFQTFIKSKWKIAPVFGGGIAKKIDKIRIGLDYRIAFYGPIKTSRTVQQVAERELVSTKVNPYISSVMLRLSYALGC
ncbi:hypothetical protein [Candidatus Odyssella acanthamoebae]|uniref:Outer membrane protein beta-barrel domain-containing protein n=1 Tax=Candidatus Odyssella acanthamoebae TaxID=91604 RepID=A0A077B2E5_9PROT|nr:hypothetical protein [Candidatus Paracaedibacter acanthamoebae]AIK97165.1 hypothetical protein ID47_11145 [Candidatus Paracaedibacter acanthamoebae]